MEFNKNEVSPRLVNKIVHGKRPITADAALHLARHFDRSPRFWLGLQMNHDLDVAEDEIGDRLSREVIAIASHLHGIVLIESADPRGQITICPYGRPP